MKSKYIGIGIIALLIGVVALSGCTQNQQNSTQNAPNTIAIQNFAFNPNTLTVKAGTKVTWINQDSTTHTVTSDNGAFQSSGNLNPGDKYTFTFNKTGTYPFHCSIHPSMTGQITVQ